MRRVTPPKGTPTVDIRGAHPYRVPAVVPPCDDRHRRARETELEREHALARGFQRAYNAAVLADWNRSPRRCW